MGKKLNTILGLVCYPWSVLCFIFSPGRQTWAYLESELA